jgi:hypothetical protein
MCSRTQLTTDVWSIAAGAVGKPSAFFVETLAGFSLVPQNVNAQDAILPELEVLCFQLKSSGRAAMHHAIQRLDNLHVWLT